MPQKYLVSFIVCGRTHRNQGHGVGWAEMSRIAQVAAQHSWLLFNPRMYKDTRLLPTQHLLPSGLQNSPESQGQSRGGGHIIITICELGFPPQKTSD